MITTLQLAEAIARAVLAEVDEQGVGHGSEYGFLMPHDDYFPDTQQEGLLDNYDLRQAVFKVLRENNCWFCQLREGEPSIQMDLTFEGRETTK